VGKPADGDSIYNGALDNASGVAGVMEIARAFASHKRSLGRSILFVFTTGEESGLLGATHYTNHPLYPLEKTIAEINIDGLNIWGPTEDMVVVGYGQSDLEQTLAESIAPLNRRIAPDSEPEKGYYYRSDHFPFAKKGVPALYADSGVEYRDRPAGWGLERRKEYVADRYHKPQDEYDASWDLSGAAQDMDALFRVGLTVANRERVPQWSETSEFRRVRGAGSK
jgi:Zn-dependent M28 family amino/carboxypeptidase